MENIVKGQAVTLNDTNTNNFVLVQAGSNLCEVIVRTHADNSGTIQFAVADKNDAPEMTNQMAYAADKVAFFTVGAYEALWAKASTINQSFTPEY